MTKQRAKASLAGIAMFLIATTLAAQVTEEWVARYDGPENGEDHVTAMVIDDSGNVYVTGRSRDSATYRDYATIKYNSSGTEQWVARYDAASDKDEAQAIAVDDAGNVYVTGYSIDSENYEDYTTVKYNSAGVEQWVARYDGPESDRDEAYAMAIDDAGNVYVTGLSIGSGTSWDYATVKYNSAGVEQWVARYDGPESSWDVATAIAVDDAGNVYVTGWSNISENDYDYATVKYNSAGVEQWVARYDVASFDDKAYDIAIDDAGNVYVTGYSLGSENHEDYATIKYNSSGTEQWVARYDAASFDDKAYDIAIDDAGNVYVTGCIVSGYREDYGTVKYNSAGVEQWAAHYDGPGSGHDVAYAMAIDDAGNVYITGRSGVSENHEDYATVKYNSAGIEQWVARYDGPTSNWDFPIAIAVDDAGNVYVTGRSYSSETSWDYATVKYSQGPAVAETCLEVPGHRLEVAQLAPEPVITYTLPSSGSISLKVYDVTGKLVRTLVSGSQEAGTHTVTWNARNNSNQQVSAGLYFIRIATPRFSQTAKVIVVR